MKQIPALLIGIALLHCASPLDAQLKKTTIAKADKKMTTSLRQALGTDKIAGNSNSGKMTWTSKSAAAKKLAESGVAHVMNVETAKGYEELLAAVKLDPDFTVALAFLANMSYGNSAKVYRERTLKSATNKTEGEKLFATLVDEKMTRQENQDAWAKLHKMFPEGSMIAHYYVVTRPTAEERFSEAEAYLKKFPDKPAMYNMLGYFSLQDKKDTAMAKQYFEQYLARYPEGYNPYDSMGEFYLLQGDKENAEKYYTMSLEKYPFNISSVNAMEDIKKSKPKTEEKQ